MEQIEVGVVDRQVDLRINAASVAPVVESVLRLEGAWADELSVHFVDEPEITEMHGDYFDDPTPTDCITFPIDDEAREGEYRLLGDLFICPKAALNYVESHGGDPYTETTLYLVHGLLHLLGYDDLEEVDRSKMRAAEAIHMERLAKERCLLYG